VRGNEVAPYPFSMLEFLCDFDVLHRFRSKPHLDPARENQEPPL